LELKGCLYKHTDFITSSLADVHEVVVSDAVLAAVAAVGKALLGGFGATDGLEVADRLLLIDARKNASLGNCQLGLAAVEIA